MTAVHDGTLPPSSGSGSSPPPPAAAAATAAVTPSFRLGVDSSQDRLHELQGRHDSRRLESATFLVATLL